MDTRTCKFCGREFHETPYDDGAKQEGYCHKLCRHDHEKQLIKEGKMESVRDFCNRIGVSNAPMKDTQYKDAIGEPIWFPKDEKPYYDKALGRTFNTKKEKSEFMKANGYIMDGSSNPTCWPAEAGDMRSRSYRRSIGMED